MSRPKRTTNIHHLYWPASAYQTKLERRFRELPCHKVEMGIEAHALLHRHHRPPRKPDGGEMFNIIQAHEQGRCPCHVNVVPIQGASHAA